ncbi:MAG: hypothetical protein AAGN46_03945 [Acidobacteriota bacterium]
MRHRIATLILAATAVTPSSALWAGEGLTLDVAGDVGLELRAFVDSPAPSTVGFERQPETWQGSIHMAPEVVIDHANGRDRFVVEPFARLDSDDSERTHVDLREATWQRVGDDWDLVVGLDVVFWGVTESRHLVNVINQIDAVEDLDEEDFLGQPMIAFGLQRSWGYLRAFVLPGFRERTFPGIEGRLRASPPVDVDAARFTRSRGNDALDAALRYSHVIGDWDLGAHLFVGTSREPRFEQSSDGEHLVPVYERMEQIGLDVQNTTGAWLTKLEAIVRSTDSDDFAAAVAGVEYTLFGLVGAADLGLLAEFLRDGRDPARAPATAFDRDLFAGARLTLNDVADTNVLLGGFVDLDSGSTSLRFEGDRRIGDAWRAEVTAQVFLDVDARDALAAFENDAFAQLSLTWSF